MYDIGTICLSKRGGGFGTPLNTNTVVELVRRGLVGSLPGLRRVIVCNLLI